ncbi:MAG: hypothetical protein HY235_07310 [Acidobacteria bacterium]|nr:hypothetical protein [Acidobacteriota bacterium]
MNQVRLFWRSFFDIRPGERLRVLFMSLYLLSVLFAYYILKPLSRALFLNKFDIDKLPWLYVLIAVVGGLLAFVYTNIAVRASLSKAVLGATAFSVACLVLLWFLLKNPADWLYYVLNIWVSLFSVILVSQGWLVAANVFNPREAKRVYGVLGVGAVIGAAFGGSFTAFALKLVGVNNLLLASAVMVLFAYGAFLAVERQPGVSLAGAKAAEDEEADFHFADIVGAIRQHRHLQVIIGIILLTYLVDVLVEFQFSAVAKQAYKSKEELTAFLGSFYGLYLNLITFAFQFFLTAAVVNMFGVGGTLQVMPMSIGLLSVSTLAFPTVLSTSAARLSEAATRYTFNRTGMELLYLPLPMELKNRTKAFVDIFMDRFARGMGGMLLVLVTGVLNVPSRYVSILVMAFCAIWILLSLRAKREYVATVRGRLEARRLDLDSVRISVNDPATMKLLEETARSPLPRQACYALEMLEASQSVNLEPILRELIDSPSAEVRGKALELALKTRYDMLLDEALREIRSYRGGERSGSIEPAVEYALTYSGDGSRLARTLLQHPNEQVQASVLRFLGGSQSLARELLTADWLAQAARSAEPAERRKAALAIRSLGDGHGDLVAALIRDPDARVTEAAARTAAALEDRALVLPMVERLAEPRLRGALIQALAQYGPRIAGTLGDLLMDHKLPLPVRRQVARTLQHIPDQRSVDVLMAGIAGPDPELRSAVIEALHRLRETVPNLNYGAEPVMQQILSEARMYYELSAALSPFRDQTDVKTPAGLLAKTIEERLRKTIRRLFYLLGLKYPPREIQAAYLAVNRGRSEEISTAIEFLDNVLERELKRVLIPLFDAPGHAAEKGREVFGLARLDTAGALRQLLESGDVWLAACAIATAAELRLSSLAGAVAKLEEGAGSEVARVARDAAARFAA